MVILKTLRFMDRIKSNAKKINIYIYIKKV